MALIIKRANKIKLFWVFFIAFVFVPTIAVALLSYYKHSGGLARQIALEISKQTNMHVTIDNVELPSLTFSQVILRNLVVRNPIQGRNPFLDASEINITGINRADAISGVGTSNSGGLTFDTITIKSYSIALPSEGGSGNSGQTIRSIAEILAEIFVKNRQIKKVVLERGRIIVPVPAGEIILGIARGELAVNPDGKKLSGVLLFDSFDGEDVTGKLEIAIAGNPESPELSLIVNCAKLDLAKIARNVSAAAKKEIALAGTIRTSVNYKAGGKGKDYVEMTLEVENLKMQSGDQGSCSCEDVKATTRFESENSTFPNLESVFENPFSGRSSQQITAKFVKLALEIYGTGTSTFDEANLAMKNERLVARVRNMKGNLIGLASFYSSDAVLAVQTSGDAWKISTDEPISGIKVVLDTDELSLVSLSGESSFKKDETLIDVRGKFLSGGSFDASAKFSILSPFPVGNATLTYSDIPLVMVRSFFPKLFPAWSLESEPVRGAIEVSLKGADIISGNLSVVTSSFSASNSKMEFPASKLVLSSDFLIEKTEQAFRNLKIDYESLGSIEGGLYISNGEIKSLTIEHSRFNSQKCLGCFKTLLPQLEPLSLDGVLILKGDFSDIDSVGIPRKASLEISVLDELSVRQNGPNPAYRLTGITGTLALSAKTTDREITVKIDGQLLPLKVEVLQKRLFMSGQRIDLSGSVKIALGTGDISMDRIRIESESGIVEEINGEITDLSKEPYYNIKFRDWGLTLDHVLSLVELPDEMKFTGGVFTIERTIKGTAASLESKYKITVNGLNLDADDIKIEGAGLILEIP